MKRPPRPGEKIWVQAGPEFGRTLFETTVWCHAGPELIRYVARNSAGKLLRPRCVRRSDEGVTWWRAADADVPRAVQILVASLR